MFDELTKVDIKKMQDELDYRITVLRPKILEEVVFTRSFGDLSENSEYDAAKDAQAAMEKRIIELDNIINNAIVITGDETPADVVSITSKVFVHDCEFDEDEEFIIVGSTESDPLANKISDESPVGKALIGHSVKDEVEVDLGGEKVLFKILAIEKQ